jgi:hypothetical protein
MFKIDFGQWIIDNGLMGLIPNQVWNEMTNVEMEWLLYI